MDSSAPGLQFDKAEPAAAESASQGATCALCSASIADTYFEANGKVVCPACKQQLERAFTGGSRTARALKAAAFGTAVAAVGAGIWYAIRAGTGYEIGLISIVIGIGVGKAVSKGCDGRGGWFYQAMAMYLTYSAVAVTYVPEVVKGFMAREDREVVAASAPAVAGADAPKKSPPERGLAPDYAASPEEEAAAKAAKAEAAAFAPTEEPPPSGAALLFGGLLFMAFVLAVAYAAPFFGGFENILGILIIAFGVWEAWRLNKKAVLVLNGPLKVGAAPPPTADPGKPADG